MNPEITSDFTKMVGSAVASFQKAIEEARPLPEEIEDLCFRVTEFAHCTGLEEEFVASGVSSSGEFPILSSGDVHLHFAVTAATAFKTHSRRQHKLAVLAAKEKIYRSLLILWDSDSWIRNAYRALYDAIFPQEPSELLAESDYGDLFSASGNGPKIRDFDWERFYFPPPFESASHAYAICTIVNMGMAVRTLMARPKYLLLDGLLDCLLSGKTIYLPELLKRYLVCRANAQGTGIISIRKSLGILHEDLLVQSFSTRFDIKDHWFLRLPSVALGEEIPGIWKNDLSFSEQSIPYLAKFHSAGFPMRVDIESAWWRTHIDGEKSSEKRLFEDLDFLCHDMRSYGYPYPLHSAHRKSRLTPKQIRNVRNRLYQISGREGVLREAFLK